MTTEAQPKVEIRPVADAGDLAAALAIREVVFIEEQQVPADIERDDEDPTAFHVLAFVDGHAIGTGRLVERREPPEGEAGRWGHVGRMAVLVSHRKQGIGRRILEALEAEARARGLDGLVLHAQVYAHGFYKKMGYEDWGTIFEEAGIPHIQMRKRLRPADFEPDPAA